jgi:cobyrinic acid a,c-diamide synthase
VQHANAAGARGVPANTSLETPLLEEGMGEVEPQNCLKKLHEKSLVKIGIARDQAFGFYYQDNLRLLQQAGAELVFFSPLKDQKLPLDLDGLYIGGGYPELFAERLSSNNTFREALKTAIGNGLPTYAECGGLMYLAKQLRTSAIDYPMVAVLKIEVEMTPQREALGYIEAQALMDTLLLKKGQVARGHEFHYSKITETWEKPGAYSLKKSDGTKVEREGFSSNDLLASYVHLHFASNPGIADRFIARCRTYKSDVKKIKMFNCAPSP